MNGGYQQIDLTSLPAPDVVEALDFETILAEIKADYLARNPDHDAVDLESDPAAKLLETAAYRELTLRQRVNDAARAVMLAFAKGNDLDQLAAPFGVSRNLLDPGDPDAFPPVAATYEDDASLRNRTPLAVDAQSVAGPDGAYRFHALSVAGVKDVSVASPAPVEVVVTVLGLDGQGVPSAEVLEAVESYLSGQDVRPLTDYVTVQAATILTYTINATLHIGTGPDADVVMAEARAAVEVLAEANHRLGRNINLSALYAALHQSGVDKVELASPAETLAVSLSQAAFCTSIDLSRGAG